MFFPISMSMVRASPRFSFDVLFSKIDRAHRKLLDFLYSSLKRAVSSGNRGIGND